MVATSTSPGTHGLTDTRVIVVHATAPPARVKPCQHGHMRESVYDAMGGEGAVLRLAHAWHERVLADEVVSHAFSHGYRDDHTERLAAYWGEQLGGPPAFTESMGDHSTVLRMHSGNGEHHEMDRRAEACFAQALDDADIPDAPSCGGPSSTGSTGASS